MMVGAISTILIYGFALAALTTGGNSACRFVLKHSGAKMPGSPRAQDTKESAAEGDTAPIVPRQPSADADEDVLKAGRLIGSLERVLIMTGLIAHSWEVMIAVIALKTVARYQDLDRKLEAEYFLVGSLVSILWAVLVTVAAIMLDSAFGMNVSGLIRREIGG